MLSVCNNWQWGEINNAEDRLLPCLTTPHRSINRHPSQISPCFIDDNYHFIMSFSGNWPWIQTGVVVCTYFSWSGELAEIPTIPLGKIHISSIVSLYIFLGMSFNFYRSWPWKSSASLCYLEFSEFILQGQSYQPLRFWCKTYEISD